MTSLLTMIILAVKFIILIMAQMNVLTNRSFLNFQCHTADFLLRTGLNWIHGLVLAYLSNALLVRF